MLSRSVEASSRTSALDMMSLIITFVSDMVSISLLNLILPDRHVRWDRCPDDGGRDRHEALVDRLFDVEGAEVYRANTLRVKLDAAAGQSGAQRLLKRQLNPA